MSNTPKKPFAGDRSIISNLLNLNGNVTNLDSDLLALNVDLNTLDADLNIMSAKIPSLLQNKLPDYLAIALTTTGTSDVRRVTALGNNPDVDTSTTPEDIWPVGGLYSFLTVATALEILSDNVNDTAAGTGSRTVLINGLDGNYDEVSQTVTLNGTTPVSIPTPLLRVNSAIIMSAGSGETNIGNLSIRTVVGSLVKAYVPATSGITRAAIYTVPNGYTLVVHSMVFSLNRSALTSDAIEIATHFRTSTGVARHPLVLGIDVRTSPYRHDGEPGITVTQKTDFTLRCMYTQNSNANITAAFLGILVKNTLIPNLTF